MIIDENRPEPNEGKVTYTYDHLDRLLYRNVYQGDVPHLRAVPNGGSYTSGSSATGKVAGQRKPKKLLYQDYYTYNNNGLRSVRRIYQPIVEAPSFSRDENDYPILRTNIICKSPVIASGFMWVQTNDSNDGKIKLMYKSMYTTNKFVIGNNPIHLEDDVYLFRFLGSNAVGPITYTLNSYAIHFVKAWAQVETGTLFSKTIQIDEI
jgi:hypothetical protein